jgi:hypothetical protein
LAPTNDRLKRWLTSLGRWRGTGGALPLAGGNVMSMAGLATALRRDTYRA